MKPEAMKPGEVVKVYEQDGKWYEEVCVDSVSTISRPATQQGVAEATASAERGVYEVLEAPAEAPAAEPAPEAETPLEAAGEAEDESEAPRVKRKYTRRQ